MSKKPRSSLKKVVTDEGDLPAKPVIRRISFSGKKFIREFDTTEKPRDYDNSYEISEHTNESSGHSHATTQNEMENGRASISTQYDQQQRSDFTLQLQTSVNVTLMPHELSKNRQRLNPDLSAPMEFDSLSLSDVEREKLRENSLFRVPLSDKTMDLMPPKMIFEEMGSKQPAQAAKQNTILKAIDMNCDAEKENNVPQKTVLFEDNNITCDFSDIVPQQSAAAIADVAATPKEQSFDMEDRDCMNYLPDESTSSPLIPLDVINENNISRKLNFRQLMDALNAGRIQLFPNGPRTPTTDKIVKPPRFWHGLENEQQPQERDVIKPRGTLNFSESMMMSPAPQQQQPNKTLTNHLDEPFGGKKEEQTRRNNRFSQADELMLDNTNFLVHAKMGDETQSRNSSKSASRRETTYDNTAMELDDIEKQEAAVVAALEKATRRPSLQRCMAMDEHDVQPKQTLSTTMQLNESIEIDQADDMETSVQEPAVEQEYVIRRKTLHFAEAIDEDRQSPQRVPHSQTMHFAEDMDEDMPSEQREKQLSVKQSRSHHHSQTLLMAEPIDEETKPHRANVVQSNRRRQTVLFAEDIDEEPPSPRNDLATAIHQQQPKNGRRQTLHVAEPIEEDIEAREVAPTVVQDYNIRRQTLHFVEAIDEDPSSPRTNLHANSKAASSTKQAKNLHRQTLLMAEPIEEDLTPKLQMAPIKAQQTVPLVERATNQRKQSLCFQQTIDIDTPSPAIDSQSKSRAAALAQQTEKPQLTTADHKSHKRRQTLHLAEPMEEEPIKGQPITGSGQRKGDYSNASLAQQTSRRRETILMAEAIEVEELKSQEATAAMEHPKERRRQTLHLAEPMEEEPIKGQPIAGSGQRKADYSNASLAGPLAQQTSRRRETLLMAEAIEVEELKSQEATAAMEHPKERRRQTLHLAEPMEEEPMMVQPIAASSQRKADSSKANLAPPLAQQKSHRRETLLMAETIEVEEPKPQLAAAEQQSHRRRQTLHLAEPIEEELIKSQAVAAKEFPISQRLNPDSRRELPTQCLPSPLEYALSRRRETLIMAEPIEEEEMQPVQSKSGRRQTLHLAEPIEEELMQLKPSTASRGMPLLDAKQGIEESISVVPNANAWAAPLGQQSKQKRQTMLLAEPIEEDPATDLKAKPAFSAAPTLGMRRQTLYFEDDIEEDILQSNADAALREQQSNRRGQTMLVAEAIEEETVKVTTDLKAKPALSAAPPFAMRRQTLYFEEDIEEDILQSNADAALREQQSNRRGQTMLMAETIQEETVKVTTDLKTKPGASAAPTLGMRRQTLYFEEDIEEDIQRSNAAMEQQCNRRRQTMHVSEPIEEDSFSVNVEHKAASVAYRPREAVVEEPASSSSQRRTLLQAESMEKDSISQKQLDINSRPSIQLAAATLKQEAIEIDDSWTEVASTSYQAIPKQNQTLRMPVDMDKDELPTAAPSEPSGGIKPRMTFLENMDHEFVNSITGNADRESPSDSAEWLAQMNAQMRKTLMNPGNGNTESAQTSVETPKNKKMLQRSFFPITPGISIVEYEDLEVMCNIDSSEAAAAPRQPAVMDMDVSGFGTPLSALNVKRLPIHLTPNLPQPKKRNTQHSGKQKDNNNSQLQLEVPVKEETTSSITKNKSHKPLLCKTLNSPWPEAEQLDGTVQIVRAQMLRQTRSLFGAETLPSMEQTLKPTTIATYEDNPITISDVSSHFAAQKELAKQEAKNTSSTSRSSSENSNKSYARAHKKFLNISGVTEIFDAAEVIDLSLDDNEIEKTRLSLVSTLLDEEESSLVDGTGIEPIEAEPEPQPEPEPCLVQVNPPAVAGAVDACKKCTHCRRSLNVTLASETDAFELPDWNALELGLERLKRLRQHPTIDEVNRYWELKDLERYSNASDNLSESSNEETNEQPLSLSELLSEYNRYFEEMKKTLPEPVIVGSYAQRLRATLNQQVPRWIFDCELQCDRQYIVTHRSINTFRLVINYTPQDDMETEIRVRSIKAKTCYHLVPRSHWSVDTHVMDFQLRLALPLNLMILLDGNKVDDVVKFLKHIDTICVKTKKLCNALRLLVISKQAVLIREPNRTILRKTVRKMRREEGEAYSRYEKINFLIEISNVEKVSFENILQPPLYKFDEKIQFLPKGIAFLESFLENPEQYLKPIIQPTN
ncbi:hypothetical protein KR044_003652 [Drosophila immigrans]|nr:hypothetical protein KR044_003652 [Drosophila immigrans]